ncbi:hypothetical protein B0H16DRAFT_803415 [Mycena metata]|uniref:Uncharacterized protein n=1 Tax=Mycena metata TaxID=1033252 RepID=A0AAD7K5W6_9AGAR|nr:hypothetical protein B0H16DRAFT_803415 [Mycena metata]
MGAIQSLSSFLSTPHALSGCSRVNQTLYRGGREDGNRSQWLVLHSLSCVPRRSELKMDLGPSRDGLPPGILQTISSHAQLKILPIDGVRILSSLTSNSGNPNFIDVLPAIVLQELALYKMLTTPASSISFPSPACRRAWLSCGAHKPAGAACSQELHLPRLAGTQTTIASSIESTLLSAPDARKCTPKIDRGFSIWPLKY